MTVDQHELYARPPDRVDRTGLRRMLDSFAPHDWLILVYLVLLNLALLGVPESAARSANLMNFCSILFCFAAVTVLVRGRLLTHPYVIPFVYRVVTLNAVYVTYLLFADYLPVVNEHSVDHELYQLDLVLFGFEPAVYFDRFVTPVTTEWFAFFYFGYFFVLGLHVLAMLFLCRKDFQLAQFATGILVVFCVGHTLYLLVPGYGPYKAMPELFQNELPPGVWWTMTTELVAHSGAQKDIFPSLHTAAPLYILLFSFNQRDRFPYKLTWPIVAFFTANIIVATMFLRWHYVIDVVAGLVLALGAHAVSIRLTRRETERRRVLKLGPIWPEWGVTVPRGVDSKPPHAVAANR